MSTLEKWTNEQIGAARMDKVGRLPLETRMAMYNARKWHSNKDSQRLFVLSEIRRLYGYRTGLRALTLPGESWAFEADLTESFPATRFLCIECNRQSFEAGCRSMPIEFARHQTRDEYVVNSRTVEGFTYGRRRVQWLHAHLDELFFGEVRGPDKGRWLALTDSRFNVVWLDTNSPLMTKRMLSYIPPIAKHLRQGLCVVALSFIVGRDTPELMSLLSLMPGTSAIERRTNLLRFMFNKEPGVKVLSASTHVYGSANADSNLNIATVCLFLRKTEVPRESWKQIRDGQVFVAPEVKAPAGSMRTFMRKATR